MNTTHSPRRRRCRIQATCILLLAAGCSNSSTSTSSGPRQMTAAEAAAAEASQARAMEVTEHMLQVYRKADSYTDHATYIEESVLRGEGVPHELPYFEITIALKRPNKLRLTFGEAVANALGKRNGFQIACDGEFVRATMPDVKDQMVENPAPSTLTFDNVLVDPLIRQGLSERPMGDVFPQLAMLIDQSDDDEDAVFPLDSNPRMLDDAKLGDKTCYRVATSHPEGTRVLWIEHDSYILRRMELPVESHRQRIDPDGHYLQLNIRIDFNDVTFDAQIEPKSFVLEPAPGAHRVRRFVEPDSDELSTAAPDSKEDGTAKDAKSAKKAGSENTENK